MHKVSFRNDDFDELYFGFGISALAVAEDFETTRLVPIVDKVQLHSTGASTARSTSRA